MLCNLFSAMTIKYGKQSSIGIATDSIHMTLGILHIRSKLPILILSISILLHAEGRFNVEADILRERSGASRLAGGRTAQASGNSSRATLRRPCHSRVAHAETAATPE